METYNGVGSYTGAGVYKYKCLITNEEYFGSSLDCNSRLWQHTAPSNDCNSRFIIERGNYKYTLLEKMPGATKLELHQREQWYMDQCDPKLLINFQKAYTGIVASDEKDYKDQYNPLYYAENREDILSEKKDYYQKNKEAIIAYKVEYRKKNKDKMYEKIDCDCGGKYMPNSKSKHYKTKKHITYLEDNNLTDIKSWKYLTN